MYRKGSQIERKPKHKQKYTERDGNRLICFVINVHKFVTSKNS
jgi:hypothetical protein